MDAQRLVTLLSTQFSLDLMKAQEELEMSLADNTSNKASRIKEAIKELIEIEQIMARFQSMVKQPDNNTQNETQNG